MPGNFEQQWSELVARAWADPAFKAKLLADPAAVLKENGLQVPAGITIKVVENSPKVLHLTIPVPPAPEELSPILEIVPLQLLAYHIAVRRGCDVDQPRNLAKSVTVE